MASNIFLLHLPAMSDWTHDLAIIGAGNMAEAIARGVLAAKQLDPGRIIAADVSPQRRQLFQDQLGIAAVQENTTAASGSRIILLSVKPQQMEGALRDLRPSLAQGALIVSIAAGISTAKIEGWLGEGRWRVVRAMPNTPMLVGEGMVALSRGLAASAQDISTARELFDSAAAVIEVDESQMDAVTAVSGSGPAYLFFLAEQMISAGESLGLTPQQSRTLAIRAIAGAAKMLASSDEAPVALRRKVTSPGGTTQAAIQHLESCHVGESIGDAIAAAARRSRELGG
jgi:pyrroline-5-carboxylate reductase